MRERGSAVLPHRLPTASRHYRIEISSVLDDEGTRMHEAERVTALIGDIYDAALDAVLWSDVLRELAHFVGGQAAGLLSKDSISKAGTAYHQHGVTPQYMQLYAETFHKFDPMAGLYFFDVGQVVSIAELVPFDEFCRSQFYREWVKPQGWLDAANVVLDKSMTSYAYPR
jgi:hypothetical protein